MMDEKSPVLRAFRFPEDYEAALALWRRCGPGVHVGESDSPEEIRKKLSRDPSLFLVAELDGNIVGSVIGGFDGRRGMVYHLAVDPGLRKQGLGARLMTEVESRLRKLGCRKAYLMVIPGNPAADFYRSIGWSDMAVTMFAKEFPLDP